MGLFSDIKAMGDIVKGGLDAAKASGALEKKVKESRKDYKAELTETDNKLYKEYKKLKDKYDAENNNNTDKSNAILEDVEKAEVAYLVSLTKNKDLPKAFKREIQEALDQYQATNSDEAMTDLFEKAALRYAKNDKEREEIKKGVRESK